MIDYIKYSSEGITITRDLSSRLADGETLSNGTTVASPATLTADDPTFDSTAYSVYLASGTSGTRYEVRVTIGTSDGNDIVDTFSILVR